MLLLLYCNQPFPVRALCSAGRARNVVIVATWRVFAIALLHVLWIVRDVLKFAMIASWASDFWHAVCFQVCVPLIGFPLIFPTFYTIIAVWFRVVCRDVWQRECLLLASLEFHKSRGSLHARLSVERIAC